MKNTYRGSCHCGRARFEVDADLDHVRVCDCSICRRRGALNHRVEESDLRILTPLDELTVYEWNTKVARTVNVRCLEGVDLDAIPVKNVHGSELSVEP
jgi:hypothetical protein